MKTLILAVMLLSGVAFASHAERLGELKGVTADGRYFVWIGAPEESDEEGNLSTYAEVNDLLLGTNVEYLCTGKGDFEPGHGSADFARWLAAHPLKPLLVSRTSPDKKREADVEPETGAGTWGDDTFYSDSAFGWSLVVRHDKTTDQVGFTSTGDNVSVAWTPDGKHTIWVVSRKGRMVRDPGSDTVIIGTDGSPSVAVLAPREKLAPAKGVAEKLVKAGFEIGSVAPMMKPRDKSVVFGAKNQLDLAKKVAAAVPGGATVEPLTWHTPFDVVVALGPDALK